MNEWLAVECHGLPRYLIIAVLVDTRRIMRTSYMLYLKSDTYLYSYLISNVFNVRVLQHILVSLDQSGHDKKFLCNTFICY